MSANNVLKELGLKYKTLGTRDKFREHENFVCVIITTLFSFSWKISRLHIGYDFPTSEVTLSNVIYFISVQRKIMREWRNYQLNLTNLHSDF